MESHHLTLTAHPPQAPSAPHRKRGPTPHPLSPHLARLLPVILRHTCSLPATVECADLVSWSPKTYLTARGLRVLTLSHMNEIFLSHCPCLERLSVSHCTRVSFALGEESGTSTPRMARLRECFVDATSDALLYNLSCGLAMPPKAWRGLARTPSHPARPSWLYRMVCAPSRRGACSRTPRTQRHGVSATASVPQPPCPHYQAPRRVFLVP